LYNLKYSFYRFDYTWAIDILCHILPGTVSPLGTKLKTPAREGI